MRAVASSSGSANPRPDQCCGVHVSSPSSSRHDVFVSASAVEADPLSVAEAVVAGMPVLVSDLGAHRGQGLTGRNIFGGLDDLSARVRALAADPTSVGTLVADHAADALLRSRNVDVITQAYISVYEAALSARR